MVSIRFYRLVAQGAFLYVKSREPSICPVCNETLTKRSWRARTVIGSGGNKAVYYIRRLYCSRCRRLHHELPDCMVPYKRHCAETIEKAVKAPDNKPDVPIDERTHKRMRSWWEIVFPYFLSIIKSINQKLNKPYDKAPAFREIVRGVVNTGHWIFANDICTRSEAMSG